MTIFDPSSPPFLSTPLPSGVISDLRTWSFRQAASLRRHDTEALAWDDLAAQIGFLADVQLQYFSWLCSSVMSVYLIMEFCPDPSRELLFGLRRSIHLYPFAFVRLFHNCPSLHPELKPAFSSAWKTARDSVSGDLARLSLDEYDESDYYNASAAFDSLIPSRNPYRFEEVTGFHLLDDGLSQLESFTVPPARVRESIDRRRNV